MRAASILLFAFFLTMVVVALAQQSDRDLSEEEKRRLFLKAREEMRTVPMTPRPDATAAPKPKPKLAPQPIQTPPKPTPEPTAVARPRMTPQPPVTPKPVAHVTPPPAPVIVEKQSEQGIRPPPPSGWFQHWRYLTKPVRAALDRAQVQKGRWRYIVVHNSGTRQGNARAFEYYHRNVRKMPNGLAYHFVIGNGSSSGNGEVEIGNRWVRQINGGHVHSDYLNNIALGICLVGDFNRDTPSNNQLEALDELIRYLRIRVGRIEGHRSIVKAHREINPPRWPTDCPGDRFPYRWLHDRFD